MTKDERQIGIFVPIPVKVIEKISIGMAVIDPSFSLVNNLKPSIYLGSCAIEDSLESFVGKFSTYRLMEFKLDLYRFIANYPSSLDTSYVLSLPVSGNKEFRIRQKEIIAFSGMVPAHSLQLWLAEDGLNKSVDLSITDKKNLGTANIAFLAEELKFVEMGPDNNELKYAVVALETSLPLFKPIS